MDMIECEFCKTAIPYGARVCTGCSAEVVYGMTGQDRQRILREAMIFPACAGGLALVAGVVVHSRLRNPDSGIAYISITLIATGMLYIIVSSRRLARAREQLQRQVSFFR